MSILPWAEYESKRNFLREYKAHQKAKHELKKLEKDFILLKDKLNNISETKRIIQLSLVFFSSIFGAIISLFLSKNFYKQPIIPLLGIFLIFFCLFSLFRIEQKISRQP